MPIFGRPVDCFFNKTFASKTEVENKLVGFYSSKKNNNLKQMTHMVFEISGSPDSPNYKLCGVSRSQQAKIHWFDED